MRTAVSLSSSPMGTRSTHTLPGGVLLLSVLLAGCSRKLDDTTKTVEAAGDDTAATDTGDSGETAETGDSGPETGLDTDSGNDSDLPLLDADGDGYTADVDCDDGDDTVYPGAPELCDNKDNNCDGVSDADDDLDTDGISDCADYCPVYTSPGAIGDGRYALPMGSMQDAVDFAGATGCNEVRAFKGRYEENIDWHGYPVNAESVEGAAATILDGQTLDSVVIFQSGETADARLYDFTITNGGGGEGAGLRIRESDPTIEGNIITGNVTNADTWLGGGIRIYNGSPTIIDNEISENDAGFGGVEDGCDGGGIDVRGGEPVIAGNLIVDNTAGDGGGIWLAYSDAVIVNNIISGNAASDSDPEKGGQGGGINVQIGGLAGTWVTANLITDNTAQMFGGGIVTYETNEAYGDAIITNNTIAFNEVTDTDYGGGLCEWGRTSPTVRNNILYGNIGPGAYAADDRDSLFTYNLVYGNTTEYAGLYTGAGAGNLSADPTFTDATANDDWTDDDFTVRSGSPAIDAGDPDAAYDDGDGSRSDVGAYGGPEGSW